jgi:hypothetical protein
VIDEDLLDFEEIEIEITGDQFDLCESCCLKLPGLIKTLGSANAEPTAQELPPEAK